MSYNEGTPKIQISRQNLREEDGSWTFSKLGRMRKDEAEKVNELLQKALQNI